MEFARPRTIDLVFFCYLGVFMFFVSLTYRLLIELPLMFVIADVAVVLYQVTLSLLVGSNLNLLVLLANLISFLSG